MRPTARQVYSLLSMASLPIRMVLRPHNTAAGIIGLRSSLSKETTLVSDFLNHGIREANDSVG